MILSFLACILFSNPALAQSRSEKIARQDAAEVFASFEKEVAGLHGRKMESLSEFRSLRWSLIKRMEVYCDSMKKFPSIQGQCGPRIVTARDRLSQREEHLARTLKEDKYQEAIDKMELFQGRFLGLLSEQEDGSAIKADRLSKERTALMAEMQKECPKLFRPDLVESCEALALRIHGSLEEHEESIRSNPSERRPRAGRTYRDTTPFLRCIVSLPKLRGSKLSYGISDPSGRYRFEHITDSKLGYAFNIPMSEISTRQVNDPFITNKIFQDPKSSKWYGVQLGAVYACSSGSDPSVDCKFTGISVSLSRGNLAEAGVEAEGSFPKQIDSPFNLSVRSGNPSAEAFGVSCAIASKMRTGGWIFSDEGFEEE